MALATKNVDSYPFLTFSETSDQEVSPSVSKNTCVVFKAMLRMGVCLYDFLQWCGYSAMVPGIICYTRWLLNKAYKNYFENKCHSFKTYFTDFTSF